MLKKPHRLRKTQKELATRMLLDIYVPQLPRYAQFADIDPVIWIAPDGHTVIWGIRQVIRTLRERERLALKLRYGLHDRHPQELKEVGNALGVTRERARQIIMKALRTLRHPTRGRYLKPFIYQYTRADQRAAIARHELFEHLYEVYPLTFSHELVMRLRRRYLSDAFKAVKSQSFRQLGRLVAYSCSLQMGVCALCGDPALPSSNWCLVHVGLKNQIAIICDGCGIRFPRDPSQLINYSKTHGRTQHAVFHNKACLFKHGGRLGIRNRKTAAGL